MIVKCVAALPTPEQAKRLGKHYRAGKQAFVVVPGTEYVVFALKTLGGEPWVEIADPALEPGYLFGVPLCLFEIVNPRPSALWETRVTNDGELELSPASLLRDYYHDDLFEGVHEVVEDFLRLRKELEKEASLHRRAGSSLTILGPDKES